MSDPLRIALACEGPTDFIVIRAAVKAIFPDKDVEIQLLQPEFSAAFVPVNPDLGLGWSGVYRWCRQAAAEGGGRLSGSVLFGFHDVLVVHVDADVADNTYESGRIANEQGDLPCSKPCPPASATTDALRQVVLRWMNENDMPARCVFCTPSKSSECWVVAALFSPNRTMEKKGWECYENPKLSSRRNPSRNELAKPASITPRGKTN